jgi:RimJ/RimL family protein N-acetyltransferase
MFTEKKYCYFAVDELSSGNFCGFIGLCDQNYEASFTPCTDIGWRLGKKYWNKGYATEGARRCLDYGFLDIKLKNIKATSTIINVKSIKIMQKLGMKQQLFFNHPRLKGDTRLESCVLYEIGSHEFLSE